MDFANIVLWICGCAIIFNFGLLIRNYFTYKFGMELIDKISHLCQQDIDHHRPWRWRYEQFGSVTYDKMLLQFWKPLNVKAFYKDDSFLKEKEIGGLNHK